MRIRCFCTPRAYRVRSRQRRARARDRPGGKARMTEQVLHAGEPLAPPRYGVGHAATAFVDVGRADRVVGVDCWYPAAADGADHAVYEVVPGVGFRASAR